MAIGGDGDHLQNVVVTVEGVCKPGQENVIIQFQLHLVNRVLVSIWKENCVKRRSVIEVRNQRNGKEKTR